MALHSDCGDDDDNENGNDVDDDDDNDDDDDDENIGFEKWWTGERTPAGISSCRCQVCGGNLLLPPVLIWVFSFWIFCCFVF